MTYLKASQYPKTLRIGRHEWTIEIVTRIGKTRDFGECDDSEKKIRLRRRQTPKQMQFTLIHELIHAFEFEYNIKISHEAVYQLENAIGEFVRKNL